MSERTVTATGFVIEGSGSTEAPVPVECGGSVFASQWHLEAYIRDLRRNLSHGLDRLKAGGADCQLGIAKSEISHARAELKRLGAAA